MPKHELKISAECRDDPSCTYKGKAIAIDITVTNSGPESIGFPLAYIQRRGPVIGLSDESGNITRSIRINLAPFALGKEYTEIKPGQSVTFDGIIPSTEIMEFGKEDLDIVARIRAAVNIKISGNPEPYLYDDSTFLRIRKPNSEE